MLDKTKKKEELLLSVLDFLDKNGYKESYEKLKEKTDYKHKENDQAIVENLLKQKKINDLIIFIEKNMKLSNDEKMKSIKLLKIKKYIDLVTKNCYKGLEQKDSLNYLRNEITPLYNQDINNDELNTLTYLLFIKDKNTLKEYIKENMKSFEDNSFIINKIIKRNFIALEDLYDNYNKNLKEVISDENIISMTINDNCLTPFKPYEVWFIEISKNKNYICIGFSNANISVFEIKKDRNNEIIINLYITFSGNEQNKKDELTSICFSNDEKYILVGLNSFKIIIFDIINGTKIKEFKNLHTSEITSIINMPNSNNNNKYLTCSIDKKVLMLDISTGDNTNIGNFCRIKQMLFSEIYNCIIIISGSKNEMICYNLTTNKIEYKIITSDNEQIVYGNISKTDKGKYILYNISKDNPKIILYNLIEKKVVDKFSGHTQKLMIIKCSFGGDQDQFILSGSEDYIVYVWERGFSKSPKYKFKGHFGMVNGAEMWNNDFIISISDDKTAKIWYSKNESVKNIKFIKNEKNNFVQKENDIDKEFFNVMNESMNSDFDNEYLNYYDMQIEEEQNDENENEEENMEEEDEI